MTCHYKKSLIATAVVASFIVFPAMSEDAPTQSTANKAGDIERMVITSRKRSETIIEVPMSVSSISATELEDRNYTSATDIFRTLAGAASPRGELILRGLSGGNSAAPNTTATFTDDIPFEYNNLSDIERVEVLRGPQGTLYGSNAIGGTVRIITNKPKMNEFELFGSVLAKSENSVDGYDSNLSIGINLPILDDTLALRVNTNLQHDQRPMVNAYTGAQAKASDSFIRSQLLWTPIDDLSVNLGFTKTEFSSNGTTLGDRSKPGSYRLPTFTEDASQPYGYDVGFEKVACDPNLERAACLLGGANYVGAKDKYTVYNLIDGWYESSTSLYTLTVTHDNILDIASMTYAGSYREFDTSSLDDWSRLDMADMARTWIINDNFNDRTTHELRFQNINSDSPFDWTVGAFYDKSNYPYNPDYQWQYHQADAKNSALFLAWNDVDATQTGIDKFNNPNKNWNLTNVSGFDREIAFFADTSYTFETDSVGDFELSAGVRKFELEDSSHSVTTGIWSNNVTQTAGEESGYRKKLSASWMPESDLAIYALYSEGYRPGGNNGPLAQSCVDDPKAKDRADRYTSDSIENYELGLKASMLDGKFNFTSAIYQIDWTDIKTSVYMPTCGFSYTANAGEAQSRGIEFESTATLTEDLNLILNASYTASELTKDNDAIDGKAGDEMTMVPKYNVYLALDHGIELFGKQAYIRADMTAYGDYKTHFKTLEADKVDAYQVYNLSGRVEVSENVRLSLHINNLFDSEEVSYKQARSRSATSSAQQYITYLPERSVALRIDYTFF